MNLVRQAMKVEGGLDTTIQLRMMINIALDFAVGLVPFAGDLVDAVFKCNTRNVRLLEKHLDKKYKPKGGADEEFQRNSTLEDRRRRAQNRKSGIYHPQDLPPATAFEDFDDEGDQLPTNTRVPATSGPNPAAAPAPPAEPRAGRGSWGWFSSGRGRRDDVEMAPNGQQTGVVHT